MIKVLTESREIQPQKETEGRPLAAVGTREQKNWSAHIEEVRRQLNFIQDGDQKLECQKNHEHEHSCSFEPESESSCSGNELDLYTDQRLAIPEKDDREMFVIEESAIPDEVGKNLPNKTLFVSERGMADMMMVGKQKAGLLSERSVPLKQMLKANGVELPKSLLQFSPFVKSVCPSSGAGLTLLLSERALPFLAITIFRGPDGKMSFRLKMAGSAAEHTETYRNSLTDLLKKKMGKSFDLDVEV